MKQGSILQETNLRAVGDGAEDRAGAGHPRPGDGNGGEAGPESGGRPIHRAQYPGPLDLVPQIIQPRRRSHLHEKKFLSDIEEPRTGQGQLWKVGTRSTSARRSSTEAAEKVGTRSAPLMTEVMKSLPDSASSQVMQAAVHERKNLFIVL